MNPHYRVAREITPANWCYCTTLDSSSHLPQMSLLADAIPCELRPGYDDHNQIQDESGFAYAHIGLRAMLHTTDSPHWSVMCFVADLSEFSSQALVCVLGELYSATQMFFGDTREDEHRKRLRRTIRRVVADELIDPEMGRHVRRWIRSWCLPGDLRDLHSELSDEVKIFQAATLLAVLGEGLRSHRSPQDWVTAFTFHINLG